MTATVRLQRFLASGGVAARRKAEDMIVAGRVSVNGVVVTTLGTKVDPDHDSVTVDGEAVAALDTFYVLFNKPKGCITAVTDDRGRPTVMDYLPNLPVPVKPVGRLDFYTEGVLLLTNDGELASRLLAPASHVPKTYHVKVHGQLTKDEVAHLRDGVRLDDGTVTLPAEIAVLPGESKHTWLGITIHEGKHRQIHRMLEALGYQIDKLQRVAFANLSFHDLRIGDARELNQQELNALRDMVGLDHSAVARGTWRKQREMTDIPRRARMKARAEAEAELEDASYDDARESEVWAGRSFGTQTKPTGERASAAANVDARSESPGGPRASDGGDARTFGRSDTRGAGPRGPRASSGDDARGSDRSDARGDGAGGSRTSSGGGTRGSGRSDARRDGPRASSGGDARPRREYDARGPRASGGEGGARGFGRSDAGARGPRTSAGGDARPRRDYNAGPGGSRTSASGGDARPRREYNAGPRGPRASGGEGGARGFGRSDAAPRGPRTAAAGGDARPRREYKPGPGGPRASGGEGGARGPRTSSGGGDVRPRREYNAGPRGPRASGGGEGGARGFDRSAAGPRASGAGERGARGFGRPGAGARGPRASGGDAPRREFDAGARGPRASTGGDARPKREYNAGPRGPRASGGDAPRREFDAGARGPRASTGGEGGSRGFSRSDAGPRGRASVGDARAKREYNAGPRGPRASGGDVRDTGSRGPRAPGGSNSVPRGAPRDKKRWRDTGGPPKGQGRSFGKRGKPPR